jgi:hypothetical protein
MLGGAIRSMDIQGRKLDTYVYPVEPSAVRAEAATGSVMVVAGPTPMLRREFLISLGGFRTAFTYAEDYDLALRALEKAEVANLGEVIVYYRMHAAQVSNRHHRRQAALAEVARISARLRKAGKIDPVKTDMWIDATTVDQLGLDLAETEHLRALFLPAGV